MRPEGAVVIAVDGSPHSRRTLDWGLAEAELRGAEAVLARAYQDPHEYTQASWYPVVGDVRWGDEAAQYLADATRQATARRPGLPVTTRLLHGPTVPMLRSVSEDAQLLVVGARGHSESPRIGRISAHLAAHGRCPVAVVRDLAHRAAPVVVGVDGSTSSVAAAHVAAREAVLRGVALVVVHGRPTQVPYGTDGLMFLSPLATADADDPTRRAAEAVVAGLRAEHPGLDVRLDLVDDDPVHALVHASADAGLLVVGSRGLGAFRGMLLGAVSSEVVRAATVTVLVVHDDALH
ncbi:universal stress protein [uncultured Cellulomonas sp.]|uniref:universal stress protein n=1 Tax=uncultured Cellulomonas sp. TaxID=189682 RepID=UPI0026190625|nr:universal stress protein [uncultured Cellulomonas sp.]